MINRLFALYDTVWYSICMTAAQRKHLETLVEQKILEFFGDPDSGLKLKKSVATTLRTRLQKRQRLISHTEVMKRYGVR